MCLPPACAQKTVMMAREAEAATPGGKPADPLTPAQAEAQRIGGHCTPASSAAAAAAAAASASGAGSGSGGASASSASSTASASMSLPSAFRVVPDPTEQRTGVAPAEAQASTILTTVEAARRLVHKDAVRRKEALTVEALEAARAEIGGAVTIAYPMGLPEHEPLKQMLAGDEDVEGLSIATELLDADTATLWWAGKEFDRADTVGDRVGRNEKTKIIAKLQPRGAGPPAREPAVSEAERRAMTARYFKKQQELKALAENDDDDFMASSWADPKALKRNLIGASDVRIR